MKKSKSKLLFSLLLILAATFLIKYKSSTISKFNGRETKITGIITECENINSKTRITLKSKEKILVNYNENFPCTLGTKIKAEGNLSKPNKNTVFHQFNYRNYLLSKNIKYIFNASKIKKTNNKIKIRYKIKNKIINHIKKYKSQKYLNTFILGDSSEIDINIKESYQNNGISHLLAISGFHITALAYFITFITNKIFKNKKYSVYLTMIILILYLFITSLSAPILRATIFYILLKLKKELNLKINTIYIHLLILLILLNINPYYIYNLGFILSFTVSFYLILFNKIINKYQSYFLKTLTISLIAFISSSPIIINNSFHLNLITPIINIYFVPIISFLIYPLSIITLFIKPLDNILFKLTRIIEITSLKLSQIQIFDITLSHINILGIITYYLIITFIFYSSEKKNKNYLWLFLILIIIHHNINTFNPNINITTIDVGQGDSILLKLDHNKGNILIDTGGSYNNTYNLSKNITVPYLKSEGINSLNYLIISHGDYDHMGEAINLVNNFKVEKVILNCGEFNDLEKEIIKVLDKKKIKYYSCIQELNIDKNKLYFLNTKKYDNENDNSNVIYTEFNNFKFLFMGDASITTEKEIMDKYNLPDIDVLKIGHHGSKTSSSKEFIDEINPKYSIISVGKNNRYGHPNKETLDNIKDSKIYRTDIDGSIMFKIKNNKLKIEPCNP